MKKLSKQAEDKLLQAVERTAVLVNDGEDPNVAIAKVASEDGIPTGTVQLMVHAYNTGRTTRQREEGTTVLEKAADFPLADVGVVRQLMFPAHVKTAAAAHVETAVSTEYALPPTGILQRRMKRAVAARQLDWRMGAAAPSAYPRDPLYPMKQAFSDTLRARRQVEESRRQTQVQLEKAAATFASLTDYFRQPTAASLSEVREHAELLHGPAAGRILDELVQVTPAIGKIAKLRGNHKQAGLTEAIGEPYALLLQLMDELDSYRSKQAAYNQLLRAQTPASEEAQPGPFAMPAARSVLDNEPVTKQAAVTWDTAKQWMTAAKDKTRATFADMPTAGKKWLPGANERDPGGSLVGQAYYDLMDPEYMQELRRIQATAMLHDLMLNDSVIAGYSPDETLMAYNEIVQLAPTAADQRLLMQPLLRRRLEQGYLGDFEVGQLLDMEKKQREISDLGNPPDIGSIPGPFGAPRAPAPRAPAPRAPAPRAPAPRAPAPRAPAPPRPPK